MRLRHASLALAAALLAALPSAAAAGKPGSWTRLGDNNLDNIDQVALTRTPDNVLHAVWTIPSHNIGGAGDTLVHDAIAPNGVAAAPNPIVAGWSALTAVPDVVTAPDGSLRVFFGGIRTIDQNETNNNMNTATAPGTGAAWALQPGTIVTAGATYAADVGAALQADGTPFVSFGGTGSGTFVHRGLDPAAANVPLQEQLGGCCGYSPDVAVDTASGVPTVAWYSNATGKLGVFAQALDPATAQPTGAPAPMPGSVTQYNGEPSSSQQLTRTPIAARAGGGVYVAYSGGYPSTAKALLWRVGDAKPVVLDTIKRTDHLVGLAAAPDGRIWVFWARRGGGEPQVFARRSDTTVSAFGPAVRAGAPKGQQSAFKIDGNAQAATLDLVGLFGDANGRQAQWHTQVLPGLEVDASPASIKRRRQAEVTFTVSDPDPVKGVTVKAGGDSAKTDTKGRVTLTLGPTTKSSIKVTATKGGYADGSAKVRVKR